MTKVLSGPLKLLSKFQDLTITLADGTRPVLLALVASSSEYIDNAVISIESGNSNSAKLDLSGQDSKAVNACIDIMYRIPKSFVTIEEWMPVVKMAHFLKMKDLEEIIGMYSPFVADTRSLIDLASDLDLPLLYKKIIEMKIGIDSYKTVLSEMEIDEIVYALGGLINAAKIFGLCSHSATKNYCLAAIIINKNKDDCERMLRYLDLSKCTGAEIDLLSDPAVKLGETLRYVFKTIRPMFADEPANGKLNFADWIPSKNIKAKPTSGMLSAYSAALAKSVSTPPDTDTTSTSD